MGGGTFHIYYSEHDIRRAFKRVSTRKAAGPDGISGGVLKLCADQLVPVFTKTSTCPWLSLWYPHASKGPPRPACLITIAQWNSPWQGKVPWASGSRITSAADWTHNGLLTILTDQQKTPKTYPPHYPILPGLVRELCEISDTAVGSLITENNEKEYLKEVPLIPRQQPPPERLHE